MGEDAVICDLIANYPLYVNIARRYCREDAVDVVQASFVKALEHRDDIDEEGNVKQWMASVVHNEAVNQYRARLRREKRESGAIPATGQSHCEELSDRMMGALGQLSDDSRQLFLEYAVGGRAVAQLARKYCVPRGTIVSRLRNIRTCLREVLADGYSEGWFDF